MARHRILGVPLAASLVVPLVVPLVLGPASSAAVASTPPVSSRVEVAGSAGGVRAIADPADERELRELLVDRAHRLNPVRPADGTAALWMSLPEERGNHSFRMTFDADGQLTGRTSAATGLRAEAPAGDASAYVTTAAPGSTVVAADDGSSVVAYPRSTKTVVWSPRGDAFISRIGDQWVRQTLDPAVSAPLDLPAGSKHPSVTPDGTGVVVDAPSGEGRDIYIVPGAFTDEGPSGPPVALGLSEYSPSHPVIAPAPDTRVGGPDSRYRLAFLGTVPGVTPAQYRVFVDHQDGDPAVAGGYGNPVAVADTRYRCDVGTAPAFSPDRRRLAFILYEYGRCFTYQQALVADVGDDDRFRPTAPADLVTAFPGWSEDDKPMPALSWEAVDVRAGGLRFDGADRYAVSRAVGGLSSVDDSQAVVLAAGTAYADALTGGALAARRLGPLYLTWPDELSPPLRDLLQAGPRTVYVVGGPKSVGEGIVTDLADEGFDVVRLGGANRYEVAVATARELDRLRGGPPSAVFVSSGRAFADALVSIPPAALRDAAILLSDGSRLPAATRTYLDSLPAETVIYAVGGAGAASVADDPRTEVISGANRYEVAGAVASRFFPSSRITGIADGRNWPDAASGGPLMARIGEPLLLVDGAPTIPAATRAYLHRSRASVDLVVAFGGRASIPTSTFRPTAVAAGSQTPYFGPDTRWYPPGGTD